MSRRVIRKLPTVAERSFDERLWPVQVAWIVLGGMWAGIVFSVASVNDARWYAQPWPWLIVTGLLVVALMLVSYRIPIQLMRRAVMLAVVLSLIVNSGLLIGMAWTKIFAFPGIDQQQLTQPRRPQRVVVPEYVMQPIPRESRPRDVDRPVATGSAEAVPTDVQRNIRVAERRDMPSAVDMAAGKVAVIHPRVQPDVVESTPRRGDAPSRLSRRAATQQWGSRRAQTLLNEALATATRKSHVVPANTSLARSTPAEMVDKPTSSETARIPSWRRVPATLARRADDAADLPADAPRFRRRIRRPRQVPRTALAARVPSAVARETRPTPLPRNTELEPTPITATTLDRTARIRDLRPSLDAAPTPERAATVADAARQTAAALRTVRRRRTPVATKPTVNTLADSGQETITATPRERVDARPTDDVARRTLRAVESRRSAIPWPEQTLSPTEQLAIAERPVSDADQPAMFERQQTPLNPTRTKRAVRIPTSRRALNSPAVAANQTPTAEPTAEPARTAVSRATNGIAGIDHAPNLERGANASIGQSDLAAAFAHRESDRQTAEPALALSPSLPSRIRSTLSGQNAPATNVRAQPITIASTHGGEVLATASAAAAATIEKASSSAELAQTNAARGDTQVDLGPKRVVRMDIVGRASGGGQPKPNVETHSRLMTRSRVGGAAQIAISAKVANIVAAPADDGGRQPTVVEANPDASSVVQASFGGVDDVSRDQSASVEIGVPAQATIAEIGVTQASRSEPIEAPLARPVAGGGSRQRRLSSPPAFASNTQAVVPAIAADVTASGANLAPVAGGEFAVPKDVEVGTIVSREASSGANVVADLAVAVQRAGASSVDHAGDFDAVGRDVPRNLRRARVTLPSTATAAVPNLAETSAATLGNAAAEETPAGLAVASGSSSLTRRRSGASAFERDAKIGVGGIGDRINANVGVTTPRARSHSEQMQLQDARFIRKNVGGPPTTIARAAIAVDAFRHRLQRRGSRQLGGGVPLQPKTEEAIELGLVFLARHQEADGRWQLNPSMMDADAGTTPTLRSDTASTGLSLLAFLGAGYHQLDADKYSNTVRAGLDYLIENQSKDGNLYVQNDDASAAYVALYSHGIAALALCEAYGMTQDDWLKEPAQRALDYVVASQHKHLGGWRYTPGIESDTSVSGWMIMALKSGELAQLNVSQSVYDNTSKWLNRAEASTTERHLYRYNPLAPDIATQRHGRQPTHVMTSVGLLMRMYLGWRRDNQWMQRGGAYLAENLPRMGTSGSTQRDTYYWYYATQVMFHLGGDYWRQWNSQLYPLLVQEQIQQGPLAGSWNPYAPVPDRWATHAGRLYVTTMNLLSLEVYYRHLPIYADTAR